MRLDTPVYFQSVTPGSYDTATGNYGPDTVTESKRYAAVTSAVAETLNLLYGGLKQGSLVVRIMGRYAAPFDRIRVGEKLYQVDLCRELRSKQTFVISEVQQNAGN